MTVSIVAIGNCQVTSLVRCLRAYLPGATVTPIWLEQVLRTASSQTAAETAARADIVLTQEVAREDLGELRTEALALRCRNLILYPKVIFTGLHPDAAGLIDAGRSVISPIGAYHSRLLIAAYLAGLPVERALSLFNEAAYARLGYFDEFAKSVAYLKAVAEPLGYEFEAELQDWLEQGSFMFTFNHPKVPVMASIARQAIARLGLSAAAVDPAGIEETMGRASRWPVYPQIASRLGIEDPFVFARPARDGGDELSLETFAERSYQLYADYRPDVLGKAARPAAIRLAAKAA